MPVVCNQLWPDLESAKSAPSGDIDLVVCKSCTYIWNRAFDPARMEYAPGYENALHFSPSFQDFAETLAASLVGKFDLKGKHVVEIGCGDGHMLSLLAEKGVASAVGFDPSMRGKTSRFLETPGVEIVPEYFGPDHLNRPFDAIICRHVLEHIDSPAEFLSSLRETIGERDVPIYFEVPNAAWMLKTTSMWDVIYEHFGYWSATSIATAFRLSGFRPLDVQTSYGDQFLMIEARPDAISKPAAESLDISTLTDASAFSDKAEGFLKDFREQVSHMTGNVVVWGAGSKGITFCNAVRDDAQNIKALVDLNPRKHGLFAPGVGLPVLSPDDLKSLSPSLVMISNGLYLDEIKSQVQSLGLDPAFSVIAT